MRKIGFIVWLSGLMLLLSCSKQGPIFEKYHAFEGNNWDRFKKINFNIPISRADASYDITLILKPAADFSYTILPVYVIMDTPSGEERMNDLKINVKSGGKFVGEVEGEPVVIKTPLWKDLKITETGTCKISLENIVPRIQTGGIKEIGILVEESDKK